jgi:tryptophanyl-tRNA synthetase
VLLGLDGRKMGKSRGNGIALRDRPDEVAAKIRAARTDSQRDITFEPERRPEVANLLRLAGLCAGRDPAQLATEIGPGGATQLKRVVTDSVNAFLEPIHRRRAGFDEQDGLRLLEQGTVRARELAVDTLREVRAAMGMTYETGGSDLRSSELHSFKLPANLNM